MVNPLLFILFLWQPPSPIDSLQILPDVVLESTRTGFSEANAPYSVFRYERLESQRLSQPVIGLDRLLNAFPGLQIQNRETLALGERIQIRGMGWRSPFGVRGITVILDGIPLTAPDGQTILEVIDPQSVTRAELIRGPTAIQWGSGSGGTLLLSTKPSGSSQTIQATIGDASTKKLMAQISRDSFSAFVSGFGSDGFREHNEQSAYRFGSVIGTKTRFIVHGAYVPFAENPGPLDEATSRNNPQSSFPLQQNRNAGKSFFHLQSGVSTKIGMGDVTAYATYRTLQNPLIANIVDLNRISGGMRIDLKRIGPFQMGLDASFQSDHRVSHTNIGTGGNEQKGVKTVDQVEQWAGITPYITHTAQFGKLMMQTGLRVDAIRIRAQDSNTLIIPNASVGLSRSFRSSTWFANIRTGSEAPTLNELSNSGVESLGPETTIGLETGLRSLIGTWVYLDLAAYHMLVGDRITPYQTLAGGDRTFYRNSGEATHTGIEGSVIATVGEHVRITHSAQVNRFRFANGNRIPGLAEWVSVTALEWTQSGYSAGLDVVATGDQFANDTNTFRNDGRVTADVSLSKGFNLSDNQIVFALRIQNITNVRYNGSVQVNPFNARAYEPAAGRQVFVTVSYRF